MGNLPLFPGIFPDQMAPIIRVGAEGERELAMARWGMPGPPQFGGALVGHSKGGLGLSMTSRYAGQEGLEAKTACVRAVRLPSVL